MEKEEGKGVIFLIAIFLIGEGRVRQREVK